MIIDTETIRSFWKYKEQQLNKEFMRGQHTPEQYIEIRSQIRERLDAETRPARGSGLLTDLYSYACKSEFERDVLNRDIVLFPSDEHLQRFYTERVKHEKK